MVRVLFFGRLRDIAGVSALEVNQQVDTISALRSLLAAENAALALALAAPSVRVAIDQCFADNGATITNAREIAFMPPLSGG